ncbi:MAG: hypothetical protein ACRCYQ_02565 [Nocardioides sp.]
MTTAAKHSRRPGDVLADRYRLIDLLQETRGGRFWRAHDEVLSRDVAVHLIGGDDPRARLLMAAGRRSAALGDPRFLRVLDADDRDGLCYVVSEWSDGTSLDQLLDGGPLEPRRAAWLTAEVAAAITSAHAAGTTHGRLLPENVLLDDTGSIRIVGTAVDAALLGLPPAENAADVVDVAATLYAGLTGRWPGRHPSRVPAAPVEAGRALRPRQVRAGVPSALDAICEQVISPGERKGYARIAKEIASAQDIYEAATAFVGNLSEVAATEALVASSRPLSGTPRRRREVPVDAPPTTRLGERAGGGGTNAESAASAGSDIGPEAGPKVSPGVSSEVSGGLAQAPSDPEPVLPLPSPSPEGPSSATARGRRIKEPELEVTQAGMPIFEDDGDVSWFSPRPQPPPPPPPFETPEPRPLFAPEPVGGEPARRPRAPVPDGPSAVSLGTGANGPAGEAVGAGTASGEFWPFAWRDRRQSPSRTATGEHQGLAPGRMWLYVAAGLAVTSLVLLAMLAAYNIAAGDPAPQDEERPDRASSAPATKPPTAGKLDLAGVADFDPEGDPPSEQPDLVDLTFDGDPETDWRTSGYNQNFGPGGIKDGVGLIVDLGAERLVSSAAVDLRGGPATVQLSVSATPPKAVGDLRPIDSYEVVDDKLRVTFPEPVEGRYLTIWFTRLPKDDDSRFRGRVAEITVRGSEPEG